MEKLETTNVDVELRIIDKLLSLTAGEQIFRREIGILFKIIELKSNPISLSKDSME